MTDRRSATDDWRDLAGEYTLGLLAGDDLRSARELERTSAEFRAEVDRWRAYLAPMLEEVAEVPPPEVLWSRIARQTFSHGRDDNVIQLRKRVRRWQGFAATVTAIAAALAMVVLTDSLRTPPVQQPRSAPSGSPLVAMLGEGSRGTAVVASWDPATQQLILAVPGDLREVQNHSHELWVIPPGGKPHSLGTLPATRQTHLKVAEALARLLDQGATIAISVEPLGGSPTGSPTGPVIASGALTRA
jgi:anti-sigma-K factor RskA